MEKRNQIVCCNCCGRQIILEPKEAREDYLYVQKEWGYFSGKDGEIHSFAVCESCYDRMREQFSIPVGVKMQTELL